MLHVVKLCPEDGASEIHSVDTSALLFYCVCVCRLGVCNVAKWMGSVYVYDRITDGFLTREVKRLKRVFQDVKLTMFDEKTPLGKDIKAWAKKSNREVFIK